VGKSVAGDLGLYYQKDIQLQEKEAQWALGLNISNIGTPISYSEDDEATPIPTNLRLGGRFTYNFNEHNSLSIHSDLNKLLVPTPALYETDSSSENLILIRGKASPGSQIRGMLQSFIDAPGIPKEDGSYSVITEEFHEISFALGAEYWYRKLLASTSPTSCPQKARTLHYTIHSDYRWLWRFRTLRTLEIFGSRKRCPSQC